MAFAGLVASWHLAKGVGVGTGGGGGVSLLACSSTWKGLRGWAVCLSLLSFFLSWGGCLWCHTLKAWRLYKASSRHKFHERPDCCILLTALQLTPIPYQRLLGIARFVICGQVSQLQACHTRQNREFLDLDSGRWVKQHPYLGSLRFFHALPFSSARRCVDDGGNFERNWRWDPNFGDRRLRKNCSWSKKPKTAVHTQKNQEKHRFRYPVPRSKPQRWIQELRFGYPPLRRSFWEKLANFLERFGVLWAPWAGLLPDLRPYHW